jgi:hypothetical protein
LTDNLPDAPKSKDFKPIWSDIKEVYKAVQHAKCVFCEQRLEGAVTQDVEHFRPKAEVKPWTIPAKLAAWGIKVKQDDEGDAALGYRFLAYQILNYAISCKNCNTVFKGNLFPITKTRKTEAKRPPAPTTEQNYLIYPISDIDDDPETLLDFEGFMPIAKGAGFGQLRALVCIELFALDDQDKRKELIQDRAEAVESMYLNLRAIADDPDPVVVRTATRNRDRLLRDSQPHANCLRSFKRLFDRDRAAADKIYQDISVLLETMSR